MHTDHLVECFRLLLTLDLKEDTNFISSSAGAIDDRLCINSFSFETLQEIHHFHLLLPLINVRAFFALLQTLRTWEEMNFEVEGSFFFIDC